MKETLTLPARRPGDPGRLALLDVTVSNYTDHRHDEPDVEVLVHYDGAWHQGFIDARRQYDGTWQALVYYSVPRADGLPHRRSDWFAYDDVRLVDPPATS